MDIFTGEHHALLDTPLNKITWTVFDLETTGIHPDEGDAIIEMAAVRVENKFRVNHRNYFVSFVKPDRRIPASSTQIHGITDRDVEGAPDFAKVFYDFKDFSRDTVFVAHNAAKDRAFLKAALHEYMLEPDLGIIIDSLKLSRLVNNRGKNDLQSLSEQFNLNRTIKGEQHRALPDAKKTAALFSILMRSIFPKECLLLSELICLLNIRG